jgi:hypothetical protein
MQNNSSPALVHTVARILFLVVVGTVALVLAAAPVQAQHSGYVHQLGQAVVDLGAHVAGVPVPVDLNGDGVLSGDLELGA